MCECFITEVAREHIPQLALFAVHHGKDIVFIHPLITVSIDQITFIALFWHDNTVLIPYNPGKLLFVMIAGRQHALDVCRFKAFGSYRTYVRRGVARRCCSSRFLGGVLGALRSLRAMSVFFNYYSNIGWISFANV